MFKKECFSFSHFKLEIYSQYPPPFTDSYIPSNACHSSLFLTFLYTFYFIVVVQSLSCLWLCDPINCSMPGFPVFQYLLEFAQTHVHWVVDAIQTFHSLMSTSLPALNLSSIRVFSKESVLCIRWPKFWSFNISPSVNIHGWLSLGLTGLISLLSKGLKSVLNLKAWVLWHSALLLENHSFGYINLC